MSTLHSRITLGKEDRTKTQMASYGSISLKAAVWKISPKLSVT